jgi:hypothetical protein
MFLYAGGNIIKQKVVLFLFMLKEVADSKKLHCFIPDKLN